MDKIDELMADYYKSIDTLEAAGHKLAPGEPLHEKVVNILTDSNYKSLYTDANNALKRAINIIVLWRKNITGVHIKAAEFLECPVVKALLKEAENELPV